MYKTITAAILAGGKSSRMGVNKALMKIENKTIIESLFNKLKDIFENIIIITNEPELYKFLDVPVFTDIFPGAGPLAGIHSALKNSESEKVFIISCDIPLITREAIEFIVDYPSESDIIIPRAEGFDQQLCGIYHRNLLPLIENLLNNSSDTEIRHEKQEKRKCSVHSLIDKSDKTVIDLEKEFNNYSEELFFNMNTVEDYKWILKRLESVISNNC